MRSSSNQQKFESRGRAQQWLIRRFLDRLVELIEPLGVRTLLDAGCGEGYVARALLDALPGLELTGVDRSEPALEAAARRCPEAKFLRLDFDELGRTQRRYDLVLCSEVLEHLDEPRSALATLAGAAERYALLTVPWEPWFQLANFLRGRHLASLGNHPEHVQHWSVRRFVALAAPVLSPLAVEVSFPWILYLGRPHTAA